MHLVEANGARIPALGFGTFRLDDAAAERLVAHALHLGYRHVDTAQGYSNESGVGRGLRAAGVPRGEVFLTTKVSPDRFRREAFQKAAEERLEKLGVDYVDLLLLHWPNPEVPLGETLDALAAVRAQGLTRHAGVSNFPSALLREALAHGLPLVTNQVEYHPYLSQETLLGVLRAAGMALTAYSPVAKGKVKDDPALQELGRAHGKTPTQVALRWLVQQPGVIAIPKTASEARAAENLDIFDFSLSAAEMARVSGLARPDGRIVDPAGAPAWDV
jgi:2,5-diketo-D-gluconate reductase B